jgi:hypothetical protein
MFMGARIAEAERSAKGEESESTAVPGNAEWVSVSGWAVGLGAKGGGANVGAGAAAGASTASSDICHNTFLLSGVE